MIMKNLDTCKGNVIPVPGMYETDLSLNESAYRKFVESKINAGDKIFYLAHSASEFKYMSMAERLRVVEIVGEICRKHGVVLLAQPVGSGSLNSQIEEAKSMRDFGVDALVILPPQPVMSGKFYSCHYEKAGFKASVHGQYYIDYIGKFSDEVEMPIIFHDAPLSNNKGLPEEILKVVMSIDHVAGIKVHSSDPCCMQKVYKKYSSSKFCFDGFGKTIQFWSLIWGASGRHTCWSWFDSASDQEFYNYLKSGQTSLAVDVINREWDLVNVIRKTGFGGYKELMRIDGTVKNNLTREPGLFVSSEEAEQLDQAYKRYKDVVRA